MEENRPNRSITITLIILLLISFGWNIFQFTAHNKEVITYESQRDSLISLRVDLGSELLETVNELNNYMGLAENLDSLVTEANGKIQTQQNKIRNLLNNEKKSASLIKKLREEIEVLKALKEEYLEKIDELITQNLALQRENMILSHNVAALSIEKVTLEEKVTEGSKLKAEYVKINALKARRNGNYKPTSLAGKTNKLEACFSILRNEIAELGEKTVYLRVISPDGTPLFANGKEASFKNKKGKEIAFTSSDIIDYKGEDTEMCLSFEDDKANLSPGTYLFEVYVEGELSSVSSYLLR